MSDNYSLNKTMKKMAIYLKRQFSSIIEEDLLETDSFPVSIINCNQSQNNYQYLSENSINKETEFDKNKNNTEIENRINDNNKYEKKSDIQTFSESNDIINVKLIKIEEKKAKNREYNHNKDKKIQKLTEITKNEIKEEYLKLHTKCDICEEVIKTIDFKNHFLTIHKIDSVLPKMKPEFYANKSIDYIGKINQFYKNANYYSKDISDKILDKSFVLKKDLSIKFGNYMNLFKNLNLQLNNNDDQKD